MFYAVPKNVSLYNIIMVGGNIESIVGQSHQWLNELERCENKST